MYGNERTRFAKHTKKTAYCHKRKWHTTKRNRQTNWGVCTNCVKYMKADIFPALDTLAKLCVVIDVSADYILGIDKK